MGALNADIEHLGMERGHRTLTIIRKGGKVATIPLAPRTARAIDHRISSAGPSTDQGGGHRDPYLRETSGQGIFAVGDLRLGSSRRVAAAVGEALRRSVSCTQYLSTV